MPLQRKEKKQVENYLERIVSNKNLWAHYLTNTRSSKTKQYTFSETGLNFFLIDWSLLSNKLIIKGSSNFGMQKKKKIEGRFKSYGTEWNNFPDKQSIFHFRPWKQVNRAIKYPFSATLARWMEHINHYYWVTLAGAFVLDLYTILCPSQCAVFRSNHSLSLTDYLGTWVYSSPPFHRLCYHPECLERHVFNSNKPVALRMLTSLPVTYFPTQWPSGIHHQVVNLGP